MFGFINPYVTHCFIVYYLTLKKNCVICTNVSILYIVFFGFYLVCFSVQAQKVTMSSNCIYGDGTLLRVSEFYLYKM